MGDTKELKLFSIDILNLPEALGRQVHVFANDSFGIVIGGRPFNSSFMREGLIYHVVESRIVMVVEGQANVSLNLENFQLEKGMVVLTAPDVIMEMQKFTADMIVIGILFKDDIQVRDNIVVKTTPEEFAQLVRMAYLIYDIAKNKPFRYDTVKQLVMAMASNVEYIRNAMLRSEEVAVPSRQQQLFQRFKALVNEHHEHERGIPFYAEQLHITPHHLSAVISKASGHSVMYWINRAVILKAKVLLRTSDLMTYEVAERLHFASSPAFSNYFKRETGMTPKEFQNSK